jgi:integrase/recombinase XerD
MNMGREEKTMGRCRPLSTDEIEAMKAHCHEPRDRAILSFLERTAYRAAETASLKVKDIWDGHQIRDRVQVRKSAMKKQVGRRPIPLHSDLRQALTIWLMQLQQSGLLKPDTPLWLSRKHKSRVFGLARESLWRVIKGIAVRAGIEGHVGCHSFRKTFALRAWELSKHNILKVQEALGHQEVSSTQAYLKGALEDAEIDALFLAS